MQTASRQAYALLLLGSLTLADTVPWLGKVPSANLVISNMKGPTEQLYLAGAPLVAFHGLPIVPPGAGLNVTFASLTPSCASPSARPRKPSHEPFRLAELIERAFRSCNRHWHNGAQTALHSWYRTTQPTARTRRTP